MYFQQKINPSPKISNDEKNEIDSNDFKAIYEGRDKSTEISINGIKTDIGSAKEKVIKDLMLIAEHLKEYDKAQDSIEHVLKTRKGIISDNAFHDEGLEKAKNNTKILRSDDSKNIDGIKKEAELSLEELSKIQKNSDEEMDEYVKSYNLNL